MRLPEPAVAIGVEIGIHNGMLAMAIALSPTLLADPMAIPPAIYSLVMYFTAAAFGFFVSRGHTAAEDLPQVSPTPSSHVEKVS